MTEGAVKEVAQIQPQQKTIETMTVDELKSICYDQIMLLNQTQQNINIIQQELANRKK